MSDPTGAAPWLGPGALLETVLVRGGVAVRLDAHLARLTRSARELHGRAVPGDLAERVRAVAAAAGERAVLRVVLSGVHSGVHGGVHGGGDEPVEITSAPLGPTPTLSHAVVVTGRAGLWRHKWADRRRLVADEMAAGGGTPLYVAGDGTVLETSRGNVFLVDANGALVTPALRDDLLPGTTRAAVIELARAAGQPVVERAFGVDELLRSAAFWTSAVSGAVVIASVDRAPLPRADGVVSGLRAVLTGGDQNVR